MRVFRDFHLIQADDSDYLFFPESVKVYASPRENSQPIRAYLAGEGPLPDGLSELLAKEESLAREAAAQGRRDRWDAAADSLCLYLAHDCNLSCSYCYNDGGRSANALSMMDADVVDAAFRRYFIEPGKTYAASFYGGEPLMNFKCMKGAVETGKALERERGVRIVYSMTTNGMHLNKEIIRFIDENIETVTVSLDGPKAVNDRHRVRSVSGPERGSHDRVVANIERLKSETKAKVTIKGTLTGDAVRHYEESLRYLQSLPSNGVMLTPANTPPDNPAVIDEASYRDYVERQVRHDLRFFTEAQAVRGYEESVNLLVNLLTRRKFVKHCDAGKNPAITADGSLYACHGLVGVPQFWMGNVRDDSSTEYVEVGALFGRLNVHDVPECKRCWARYLCGGSCYAHSYTNNGDVSRPDGRHCQLVKRRAEGVIVAFVKAMADPARRDFIYRSAKAMVGRAKDIAHA